MSTCTSGVGPGLQAPCQLAGRRPSGEEHQPARAASTPSSIRGLPPHTLHTQSVVPESVERLSGGDLHLHPVHVYLKRPNLTEHPLVKEYTLFCGRLLYKGWSQVSVIERTGGALHEPVWITKGEAVTAERIRR